MAENWYRLVMPKIIWSLLPLRIKFDFQLFHRSWFLFCGEQPCCCHQAADYHDLQWSQRSNDRKQSHQEQNSKFQVISCIMDFILYFRREATSTDSLILIWYSTLPFSYSCPVQVSITNNIILYLYEAVYQLGLMLYLSLLWKLLTYIHICTADTIHYSLAIVC